MAAPMLATVEQSRLLVTGVRMAGEEVRELGKEDLVQHGHFTDRPLGLGGPDDPPPPLSVPGECASDVDHPPVKIDVPQLQP